MAYLPLDEDPNVPDGAIPVAEVTVSQYLMPDGSLRLRTFLRALRALEAAAASGRGTE